MKKVRGSFTSHDVTIVTSQEPLGSIRDGSVRGDADPEAMAVFLVGLLRGIALRLISTPPPARVKAIIDEAERSTRRALRP